MRHQRPEKQAHRPGLVEAVIGWSALGFFGCVFFLPFTVGCVALLVYGVRRLISGEWGDGLALLLVAGAFVVVVIAMLKERPGYRTWPFPPRNDPVRRDREPPDE